MAEKLIKNNIKTKIKDGYPVFGTFISTPAASMVEVVGRAGMDFVVIDNEHGPDTTETIDILCRVAELSGMTAIVRVPGLDPKNIGRMLDIGAHGIQIPMINTGEEAQRFVRACKYTPAGTRGISAGRGARWSTVPDYFNVANEETITVIMCETKQCIENFREIVRTPMLDIVFVGTGDLSLEFGVPGQSNSPIVEEQVKKILYMCQEAGVTPGITVKSTEEACMRMEQGFKYVSLQNDMRIMMGVMQNIVKEVDKVRKK